MALHPSFVAVLQGLDEHEQDIVERMCQGDWDRVTWHPEHARVYVDGKPTVFVLQPEEDPELEQYFLQPDRQPGACGDPGCSVLHDDPANPVHPRHLRSGAIVSCTDTSHSHAASFCYESEVAAAPDSPAEPAAVVVASPDRDRRDEPTVPSDVPVEATPSSRGNSRTGGTEPVTPASTGHPACPCGCGQPVVNKPTGRKKKYATDQCRRRVNDAKRRDEKAAKAATTPVVESPMPTVDPETEFRQPEVVQPLTDSIAEVQANGTLSTTIEPEPTMEQAPPPPRRVWCARCDTEGHYVEDCSQPLRRKKSVTTEAKEAVAATSSTPVDAPVEDASQRSVREAKERLEASKKRAKLKGAAPEQIVCGRCKQTGHSIFTCKQEPEHTHLVAPAVNQPLTDDELTAHSAALLELCKDGLPEHFQYSYKDDVLALYGIDTDLMDAALHSPERVEIRPESFDKTKRYCVLAFHRGDLEIILGMRNPAAPMVIAAYVTSRLEHDMHRVSHSGGGAGGAKAEGLPRNARQVVNRLRAMGGRELEVELDPRVDTVPVTYRGQDLGRISTDGDRKTSEQDYQRIQRKMAAIDRRVSSTAV